MKRNVIMLVISGPADSRLTQTRLHFDYGNRSLSGKTIDRSECRGKSCHICFVTFFEDNKTGLFKEENSLLITKKNEKIA